MARGSEVWGIPFEEMLQLRAMIDRLVTSVDWPVLTVVMSDELLSNDDGMIERDRIADVSMLAAVDAWMQLPAQAVASLDRIEGVDATWLLPGHGPAWDGGVPEAVRLIREAAVPSHRT